MNLMEILLFYYLLLEKNEKNRMRKRERERDKIIFLFFCIELETSDQIYFDVFSRIHFYCIFILYLYKILPTQQYRTQTNNTKPSVTHRLL